MATQSGATAGAGAGAGTTVFGSLRGKRVFVTGGGSGIGEAIVRAFAEQGARVAFVDIAVEASLALCEKIAQDGYDKPVFRQCDIRDIPALQAVMRELAAQIGDVEVLVNNAGNDQRHKPEDVTEAFYDDRVAINQRPMFFTCQAVIEGMKKRGGSIINLGSTSWHIANGGYPVYTTTKAAVSGLTRGLARDLGPYNIRVNTVTPGWVMTERQLALWVNREAEKEIDKEQCLTGRRVMPWHIASMVLFLASDDAAMCTAQEYIVDGGWS